MLHFLYNFLISHGLTNLIDIDGLIYAPVLDLLLFFIRCGFLAALLGLVLVVVLCWLCQSIKCNHPSKDG